ncbi:MAG: UDP-forming cellulose synthase catalytic subunit [Acetobacteraceae bacterium]|nr:UDP-forming cellulose synthase catalytic subunit [Acetobacteraceae bacterium]
MSLPLASAPGSWLRTRWMGALLLAIGSVIVLSVATVPLGDSDQAIFASATVLIFLLLGRREERAMTLALVALSCAVSARYIVWRLSETIDFTNVLQGVLGTGLVLAELYSATVMVLGYFQTAWPLERQPEPLPDDVDNWPSVDVFIPTYNESLSVVRATVLAALAIDYPRDKLRVYILDDGRRSAFRDFAEACGAGYIIRGENSHAKAGNLNHAMRHTDGEFIAIFDCDHVPTRAFLQMTVGWLVRDEDMALLQTPHHFYSPDPFQRNLAAGTKVPSEGNMFYALVQTGNDFWDAAFFCGSCAVIRRRALESIGGFAVQTVTEDAHTALRLQRQGWRTGYLKIPLAAGLATERLSLHIGQRMRWGRGMIQIFRTDNPMLGPGLRLPQRLCYTNAMLHFLFAVPRLVFLTSPLAFLFFNQNLIAASPLAIVAYAGPHIFHAVATNSRIQGSSRHSFWSEIYETVMALFLLRLTVVTLLLPKRGKFNVTDKGGLLESGYFDLRAVYPNLILAAILMAGIATGISRLLFTHPDRLGVQALTLNTIWLTLSLLIVAAALAVGRETRQLRSQARVRAHLAASIHLPDGRVLHGTTRELSLGGSSVIVPRPDDMVDGAMVQVAIPVGDETVLLPARVQRWHAKFLQLAFKPATMADESNIVQAVFGRADTWLDWDQFPKDRIWHSLWTVLISIAGLFRRPGKPLMAPLHDAPATAPVAARPSPAVLARESKVLQPRAALRHVAPAGAAVALLLCIGAGAPSAQAAPAPAVRLMPESAAPGPAPVPAPALPILPPPPQLPPGDAPGAPLPAAGQGSPMRGSATRGALGPDAPVQPAPERPPLGPGMRRLALTLRQLGAAGPMTMRGTSEIQGLLFGVRADEVVVDAELTLSGAVSPALIPESSNVTVTLNEQYVGTIPADRDQPVFGPLRMPVNPVFFGDNNRLNFRFTGRYTNDCNDPLSGLLWATVSDTSTLTLTLARLPAQHSLAQLPLPFFDRHEVQSLVLPFVLPAVPGNATLRAAAIVSSWFGRLAGFRGADFPVLAAAPAQGNAVLFAAGQDRAAALGLHPFAGPTLAVVANATDPYSRILVVGGRDEGEVAAAATMLTVGDRLLGGEVATVEAPDVPARRPYDAPARISTDRPVKFGELVDPAQLQGAGYVPGTMRVPFNTAPDLYTWRRRPFAMEVLFRAPPGPVVDVAASHLDVGINGQYLRSYSLAPPEPTWSWLARAVGIDPDIQDHGAGIPPYAVFGRNELQLSFDARAMRRGDCVAIPGDIHMSVDPDSTIDLSRAYRFTELPNLAFLVNSGFPFTRMADLSETAVVLPDRPSPVELSAFLGLMGIIGSVTNYPVLRVEVVRPDGLDQVADRDLIQIGTLSHLGRGADLLRDGPVRLAGERLEVTLTPPLATIRRWFGDRTIDERQRLATNLIAHPAEETAMLIGMGSPLQSRRSLVSFLAVTPQGLLGLIGSLRDTALSPSIQGDFALLAGGRISSYRVQRTYTVGSLPFWLWPEWLLRDSPLSMIGMVVLACAMISVGLYWSLRRAAAARLQRRSRRA